MAKIQDLRWRSPPSSIFPKSGIVGYSTAVMVNIYQRTIFEANVFINDRDVAKSPKSKMAAAAILNFDKSVI